MSMEGDLLYFPELNHETPFDEADFDKDLFGPATSGLSEHSGIQAEGNYGSLVSDPLNIGEEHFFQSLNPHEELEVDSRRGHTQSSNLETNAGGEAKQEMQALYANGQVSMVPMSSGPMYPQPGIPTTGGYVPQGMHPPRGTDFGAGATAEQFDRLALENQHMQQYRQQQELLQAQARQLQAQQQQLQNLQQAQLQHALYGQGNMTSQQPVVFLGPRPGGGYLPSPRGVPQKAGPQVMYAIPHLGGGAVQMQPLPGGATYHSVVAPIPIDHALSGKYYNPMVTTAPPLQMHPIPAQNSSAMPPPPLHVSAPVSSQVSRPRSPHPPSQASVKVEEGVNSPTLRQGGRTSLGGGQHPGRSSPPGDKKPPRSPTVPDQHPRPPLPTSQAVYMPVQYIQGGAPSFPRVASEDLLSQINSQGDVLRPLPPMQQRGGAHGMSALQRSQSSHSLGQLPMRGGGAQTDTAGLQRLETAAPYQMPNQGLGSMPARQPSTVSAAGMRRVQSTGDIQSWNQGAAAQANDGGTGQYDDFKVGRYTMEERKMRIQRYRQKRNERNYNKKIKYVCRKTLADSRPRIRGRFAKNDEVGATEAKKALDEVDDDSDFDEDMLLEEGGTLLMGGIEFDVAGVERSLASLVSAPATLSA